MIVVVIIGLLAAMAIPAFQKVRATSQEKAITNNLRQVGSAAQQYFLEEGVTSVALGDLVGPDKYINQIETVASETYPPTITAGATSITTGGTPTVTYTF
jgi:type IV pilus assembly protein PilA